MAQQDHEPHNQAKPRAFSLTFFIVALIVILLLAANLALGYALVHQSASTMKSLINQRMLDVSNTAAAMLNGDELEQLFANNKDSEAYRHTLDVLNIFLNNIDLKYIYTVKQVDENTFVFTIDPETDSPASFGDPVTTTKALKKAAGGVASVDEEPYEDSWGRFYSAYSPVYNSKGDVAGIVAVDFDANWYDAQIAKHVQTGIAVGVVSLVIGGLVVAVISSRMRRRFRFLYGELSDLATDLENLNKAFTLPSRSHKGVVHTEAAVEHPQRPSDDSVDALSGKIHEIQDELHLHIEYIREQAYTDSLTGVGNKAVYVEEMERLTQAINEGNAQFSFAVFDINGLKEANDTFGHEQGDQLIINTAQALCDAFNENNVYRIGGDEFIIVLEHSSSEDMTARFSKFDTVLQTINQGEERMALPLSVSKGFATFDPATDSDYRAVFRRADEAMYGDKTAYYEAHGGRVRHYAL